MSLVRLFSLSLLWCCPVVDNSESPLTFRSGFLLLRAHQHRFTFVPDSDLKWWWQNCKLSLLCWRTLIATYSSVKVSHRRRKSKIKAAETRLMAPLCCLCRQAVFLFLVRSAYASSSQDQCKSLKNKLLMSVELSHVALALQFRMSQCATSTSSVSNSWYGMFQTSSDWFFYDLLSMRFAHIVVARLWNLSLLLSGLACKVWFASGRNGNFSFF